VLSANPLSEVLGSKRDLAGLQRIVQARQNCEVMSFPEIGKFHQACLDMGDDAGALDVELATEPRAAQCIARAHEKSPALPSNNYTAKLTANAEVNQEADLLKQFSDARRARVPAWVKPACEVLDAMQVSFEALIGDSATAFRRQATVDYPCPWLGSRTVLRADGHGWAGSRLPSNFSKDRAQGRNRTADTGIFRPRRFARFFEESGGSGGGCPWVKWCTYLDR